MVIGLSARKYVVVAIELYFLRCALWDHWWLLTPLLLANVDR